MGAGRGKRSSLLDGAVAIELDRSLANLPKWKLM
jgi:hypothetical protein